jgi:gluconate 2-dehydrogenase gamma chain
MAGQSLERRDVLEILSLAAVASRFQGFHRWRFICEPDEQAEGASAPAGYTPQFFTPEEYQTLEGLAALIIPSDGTPGAREAGVSEFIDFMVTNDPSIQYEFRYGLTWLDGQALQLNGTSFRALDFEKQTAILKRLAYREQYRAEEEDGRRFFRLLRRYTVMGFYTTRLGLQELDYPGLKFYSVSPACAHKNDPSHVQVSKHA